MLFFNILWYRGIFKMIFFVCHIIFYVILFFFFHIRGHSKSTYSLKGREGVRVKANVYCFYDVILLFKNEQRGEGLKITKFERTYFLNGPLFVMSTEGILMQCTNPWGINLQFQDLKTFLVPPTLANTIS